MTALAHRLRINEHLWGLSVSWFAVCFGNDFGDLFWIQIPFVYFGVNKEFVELNFGKGKYLFSLMARWGWE